jgi:hypothetical protein
MSNLGDEKQTTPLSEAKITARMTAWMLVEASGDACLFGFAEQHPNTGGLSWILSTPVVELTGTEDRARTASGRVYALGQQISTRELDEEGRVALRLLLQDDEDGYPGRMDDVAWVTSQKIARHLRVDAPPRADPAAVERFLERYLRAYLARGAR